MIGFDDHCQAIAICSGAVIVMTAIVSYTMIIITELAK